jgi:amino acid adenylation domain-containing protein
MVEKSKSQHPADALDELVLLPLSPQQARWWHLDKKYGTVGCQTIARLGFRGRLDHQALRAAFDRLVARHSILRTRMAASDGAVRQYLAHIDEEGVLKEHDVEGRWGADQFCRLEAEDPLRLNGGALVRGTLLRLPDREYILTVVLHPIICDSLSVRYLLLELLALYRAAIERGERVELPAIRKNHPDYALAEHLRGGSEMSDQEREYWRQIFESAPNPFGMSMPSRPRAQGAGQRQQVSIEVPRDLVGKVAERHCLSPHSVLVGTWAAVFLRWLGRSEVLVGIETTDRLGHAPPIGPVRTLIPLFLETSTAATVEGLFQEVSHSVGECQRRSPRGAWEDVLQMQSAVNSPRPVMQFALGASGAPGLDDLRKQEVPGLTIDEVSSNFAWPCAALSIEIGDPGITSSMIVTYSTDVVDHRTVESAVECWQSLLEGMFSRSSEVAMRLPPRSASNLERVATEFNDNGQYISPGPAVHGLFSDQVKRTPDCIAVEHDGRRLTYRQLNARANQLARYLVNQGVGKDRIVGVCMDRGIEMLVAVLGILKAGGAYLPLDPNYPCARLRQMLEDAAPHVLITETELMGVLPSSEMKVIGVDQALPQIGGFIDEDLETARGGFDDESLVYVIYTSGSTGRPKGIAMPHCAMTNLIEWHRKMFGMEGCRVVQFAALSFDVAFQEIFTTLCTGGTLVLLDEWMRRDVNALTEFLSRESIQRLFVPPVMLQSIAEHCQGTATLPEELRDVITAGEQLRITPATRALFRRLPSCRLHNHYGPAETHVVTAHTLSGDAGEWPDLPAIGRPIANAQICVLDGELRAAPVGMPGEIYIGGSGLARGYLNQADLTRERFIADPCHRDPTGRLYKTGDLGRWRPDGLLEFLGRNDDQVKIRGFRIEIAEIEALLARHEQVKEVAVVARGDIPGEKRIVAYVTPRSGASLSGGELRAYLKRVLPDYMMPSAFMVMEKLPLTPSGKVDRRALPPPGAASLSSSPYEAPEGELEMRVAAIWQEVLQVERVGRHDDFFELGGHSLFAVRLLARLRLSKLSAEASSIYLYPTLAQFVGTLNQHIAQTSNAPPNGVPVGCERISPEMLPLVELTPEHVREIVHTVSAGAKNVQDVYPLSPLQEGMLFHHLVNGRGADTYVIPMLFSLPSKEKLESFTEALQEVIRRHDVLRTAVLWEKLPHPLQVVHRKVELAVEEFVLHRNDAPMLQLLRRMEPQAQTLDLRRPPLMRLQTTADPEGERWFAVLQLHHLIGDHEAEALLLNEVSALMDGEVQALGKPAQYREHVARSLAVARSEEVRAYFQRELGDVSEPTAPFDITDVYGDGRELRQIAGALPDELAQVLRREARRARVSTATLFHVAWAVVLSRICGHEDVVFGTLVLGRAQGEKEDGEAALGLLINTLPVRVRIAHTTVRELSQQVHRGLGELLRREHASLAIAQRCCGLSGSAPLFTTLLNYRYASRRTDLEKWKRSGFELLAVSEWTNYPIVLSVDDEGEGFALTLQTDRRVDPRRMLKYVRTALESLVEALERNPSAPAHSLRVLPEEERREVIEEFNPKGAYPQEKLIHELFEAQVRLRPQAVAVRFEGQWLTYAELNARANQLAWYLRRQGVGPDQLVGLCVERGLEMVIGLLGILKAGGAYLPLDPVYPPERLAYMLEDAAPAVVLTQERLKERLAGASAKVVALDSDWKMIGENAKGNLALRPLGLSSDHLAYVIYTSGSTGKPKGVMVEHRNVVRLFAATEQWFGFGERDVWTLFHSYAFDFSVWELWGALLYGGRVVIVPQVTARSAREFYRLVCEEGVTVLNQTPSAFSQLIEAQGQCTDQKHGLRVVIFGGEALEFRTLLPWVEQNGIEQPQLVNMYGITETTVHVTYRRLSQEEIEAERGSIVGSPIPDLRMYLLDRQGQPVPIGVAGEIYVGGAGVARGYLNRAELTAERFLPDPFSAEPKARMYRSGDLGRWRPDGTIEYLGRNDDQVKIRGFRIELGEIEAQLTMHPQVKEALVIAREDAPGEKRLVAYVIPREPSSLPRAETLREHLKETLPEYMVPSAFVTLDSFPLTSNGKRDRRALPMPELSSYVVREYEAPQGEVEEALAQIWRKLLRVDRIGRHDNFFELGGHSLQLITLNFEIQERFSVDLSIANIFIHQTLRDVSDAIEILRLADGTDDALVSTSQVGV